MKRAVKKIHLPFRARVLLATILLVVIVGELFMLAPSSAVEESRNSWVAQELLRIDRDPGLSRASRQRLQRLMERSRLEFERTKWNRLFLVVLVTAAITTVISMLIWARVLKPVSKLLAEEKELLEKQQKRRRIQSFRLASG